jgi:hypothetical protein
MISSDLQQSTSRFGFRLLSVDTWLHGDPAWSGTVRLSERVPDPLQRLFEGLHAVRGLRNLASHPSDQSIFNLAMALDILQITAEILNEIFEAGTHQIVSD